MSAATLLVELFCEELPPRALKRLGDAFAEQLKHGLAKRGHKCRIGSVAGSIPGLRGH